VAPGIYAKRRKIMRYIARLPGVLVAALILATPFAAAAQTGAYPNKPIRLIVPFPPGGGTDLVSRTMQPGLSAELGQQILIDNRGGAQGSIGTAIAATANPDGYTLVIAEIGATAVAPALMPRLSFSVARDFAGISQLIEQPYIMSVHPSVPARTLAEFIKLAQSKPGALNFGSGNVTAHIAQEAFFQTAKIKLAHIPYRGSGPSVAAAVAGEVQTLFSGLAAAGGDHRQTFTTAPRSAHSVRAGLQGFHDRRLVRPDGTGRHAQAGHCHAQQGSSRGAQRQGRRSAAHPRL
jgi:tripartite-type tricarboxylate transporter receptor subunit TctC